MEKRFLSTMILVLLTIGLFTTYAISADVPMMTKEQLKAVLGNPEFVIFDVRLGSDYFASDLKIKGAVRPNMDNYISATAINYPIGKTFIIYCASPNEERSRINANVLIEMGIEGYKKAYVLKGGWEEWFKAGYPTEKK